MELWKHAKCGTCKFKSEAPGAKNPADLSAPPIYICRYNPPQVIYAMMQGRVQGGPPQPVPLGSMFPLIDDLQLACSHYEKERPLPDSLRLTGDVSRPPNVNTKPM